MHLAALLRADPVLDADHALDLPLDLRAVSVGLRDHLDRLARVLGDVELGAVEQDRVPARSQAGRDPPRSGQWSRCSVTGTGTSSARARQIA